MDSVLGVYCRDGSLGDDGQGSRLPAVHMGTMVQEDAVWWLSEMSPETDLVGLCSRDGPKSSFKPREFHDPRL